MRMTCLLLPLSFGRGLLSKEAMFWCLTKVFLLGKDKRIGNDSVNFACTKLKSKSPTLYQCGGHACLWLHLLFGCGLLSKEDAKSYVWLFKSIFSCFFFFFLIIMYICFFYNFLSFFFYNLECPGQLMHTTTNPRTHWTSCKLSRHVRYRENDRHVHVKART
jgi:hypothetical protein